ncbi:hypothetical protein ACTJKN_05260 [Pedobacter sp. 22163]|uniref:hypothetical protein n=1 Tax=Pedobacter sp. 22163 TaxID=3453883 RepID=UPI003F868048
MNNLNTTQRTLDHEGREVFIQHDYDFVSKVLYKKKPNLVWFLRNKSNKFEKYEPNYSDWYIAVAVEKLEKIKEDRHLIDSSLIMSYRWAIREGFNHQLDPALKKSYDYPGNRNNIKGVLAYIDRIKKASGKEMEEILSSDNKSSSTNEK